MSSLLPRYFIVFTDKLLEGIPSLPESTLRTWQIFKSSLKEMPISIETLHKHVSEFFQENLTLEQMEKQISSSKTSKTKSFNKKLIIEDLEDPNYYQESSPRLKISPISNAKNVENKNYVMKLDEKTYAEPIPKNFRSATVDFQTPKARILNPFLGLAKNNNIFTPQNPHIRKISEDELENNSSPMLGKLTKNEFHSQKNKSRFMIFPALTYSLNSQELLKKVDYFKNIFVKNTMTLETINEKSFEISTPLDSSNENLSNNDNFSNHLTDKLSPQDLFFLLPLKKKSIFAKNFQPQHFANLDKHLMESKGNKFIFNNNNNYNNFEKQG